MLIFQNFSIALYIIIKRSYFSLNFSFFFSSCNLFIDFITCSSTFNKEEFVAQAFLHTLKLWTRLWIQCRWWIERRTNRLTRSCIVNLRVFAWKNWQFRASMKLDEDASHASTPASPRIANFCAICVRIISKLSSINFRLFFFRNIFCSDLFRK